METEQRPSAGPVDRASNSTQPGTSLVTLGITLLRHPRLLVWLPVCCAVLAVSGTLLRGLDYSAQAQFEPRSADAGTGQFTSLAAQFGVNIGAGSGEPLEFYAMVLKSKDLLRAAVLTEYTFSDASLGGNDGDTLSGTLIDVLGIEESTQDAQLRAAVRTIDAMVSVNVHLAAGLVTLRTTAPWPALAVLVNRRLLALLNTFNMETRQSQAASERRFVEERLAEARLDYERAEEAQRAFHERNRQYQNSPALVLEAERLQRQVNHHQQVFTALQQAFEQARIDEVRNTPVINIIDPPENNVRSTGGFMLFGLLGFLLGTLLAVAAAFTIDHVSLHKTHNPDEFAEFVQLRRTAFSRLLPARGPRKD